MYTAGARRSFADPHTDMVSDLSTLVRLGWSDASVRAQLRARRWQRVGRAVVLHNGTPTRRELASIALVNHGPRAVLTAFTAAERAGMTGWLRDEVHVMVPAGARVIHLPGVRTHWRGDWPTLRQSFGRPIQALAPALVVAAGTFLDARPACGIVASGVQQRLVRAADLRTAIEEAPRVRHRALLLAAVDDIGQGAQALREIDFARLCRRYGLPEPVRQAVRVERAGRRRYLDAQWLRRDGRRLVAEVDGALHLITRQWWSDQLRQNEIVLAGDTVLRFPSAVVRAEPGLVADQLRRALFD